MPRYLVNPQIHQYPMYTGQEETGGSFDTLENATAAATAELEKSPTVPRVISEVVTTLTASVKVSVVPAETKAK